MTALPTGPERFAEAFRRACLAELDALKPGNVHRFAPGHRMTVADFETSAAVAAPEIAAPGVPVGRRIRRAVAATMAAVGQNTNLGILLLAGPLLVAAERGDRQATVAAERGGPREGFGAERGGDLRAGVAAVLAGLDRDDAEEVFGAIRLAAPGGLGAAPEHDVAGPAVDLRAAMAAAAERDTIARQYATDFADLFDFGVPAFDRAVARHGFGPAAVGELYLAWLAARPDSHVVRKWGPEVAEEVRRIAEALIARTPASPATKDLLELDESWKRRGINPGTSADLTVATILSRILAPIT